MKADAFQSALQRERRDGEVVDKIAEETFGPRPTPENWVLPGGHLSYSSLHKLIVCPRQYQRHYILKIPEKQGAAGVLGTGVHTTIDWALRVKGDGFPTPNTLGEYFTDMAWPRAIDDAGGIGEITWRPATSKRDAETYDSLANLGSRMLAAYRPVLDRIEPKEIEREFFLEIPEIPIPIKGYIDVVQEGNRPSIDIKTSQDTQTTLKPQWLLQGRIYQLVEHQAVDWHVITKHKTKPQVWTGLESPGLLQDFRLQTNEQTKRLLIRLAWQANFYYATYGADEDWPWEGISHDWACKFCSYRGDCPGWAGEQW